MGVPLFEGRLVTFYGKLVRIRGSHRSAVEQVYDLEWFSLNPSLNGFAYGTAIAAELEPLTGSLHTLLSYLEPGHRVCYLPGGIAVRCDRDGLYRADLFPPLMSDPVFYLVPTPSDVFSFVGYSYASDVQWELQ